MGSLSEFVLEQHRVYLLRDFEFQPTGDIVCSAFAHSDPEKIVAARFRNVTLISAWQDTKHTSMLPWPLEVVSFQAASAGGKRFRFQLICLDFQREWESDWPELM
jgi:hypothetical protein